MSEDEQEPQTEIQDFILSRELAEVYLLMDHLSACQNKEIPATLNSDAVFKNDAGRTWIEQICDIAWPPEDSTRAQDARNAAKLLRAKDALNKAASPATGSSIAFTLMIAGEARDPQAGSWWRRALRWMADVGTAPLRRASKESGSHGGPPEPPAGGTGTGPGWPGGKPPSRASLAQLAYPSLARRAWRYRIGLYAILVILVAWLMLTCILSWDVATGSSLLDRVTALETRVTTLETAALPPTTGGAPTTGSTQAPAAAGGPPPPSASAQPAAQPPAVGTTLASGGEPPFSELERARWLREVARENLGAWLSHEGRIRPFLVRLIGGTEELSAVASLSAVPVAPNAPASRETNSEWAAVLLSILASNILPIFYGLLGAGAAVVRQVSQKMRDSLLAPRDIILGYVQIALGAVIGACIGLFVDPEGNAASTPGGLLGSVPLSASALCFVAGFGVEGMFQALESLIRRVFNLDPPRPAPSQPS